MLWGHGQPGVTWDTPKAGRVCVVSTTHGSSWICFNQTNTGLKV